MTIGAASKFPGLCCLALAGTMAASGPARGQDMQLTLRAALTPPTSVRLEDESGDRDFSAEGNVYRWTIPAARAVRGTFWSIALAYGDVRAKIVLEIRQPVRELTISLPYRAPQSCHTRFVAATEVEAQTREEALERMLAANHLLALADERQRCRAEYRPRLIRARLAQNNYLVRNTPYFAIVPAYRQEYAALLDGPALQLAGFTPDRLQSFLAVVDQQSREVTVGRIYSAQLGLQSEGDLPAALALLEGLAGQVDRDADWARAALGARVNVARDVTYLRNLTGNLASPASMEVDFSPQQPD